MKENIALPFAEQRRVERSAPLQSCRGTLSLSAEEQSETHAVLALRDLSPFGVGVDSSLLVDKGKHVRLTYREADRALAVVGTVVWHRQASPAGAERGEQYHLGIELRPSDIAKNIHFFRCISGAQQLLSASTPSRLY